MPRLKEAGFEAGNEFANTIFEQIFEGRDPVKEGGTNTGTPGNWWTVFNIVPDAFRHTTEGFRFYRSRNRKINPRMRELGQIRAGYTVGSQFVYSQHCKACRHYGFTEEEIAAIPHWEVSDCFNVAERSLLAYTDALVLQLGRVPDGIFDEMKKHFSDEEILEFTYITCSYMMHGIMCRALRLEYDDVDERVVEIDAPPDANLDVMRVIDEA